MFPCHRYTPLPHSRRAFLRQAGCGFGAVALAALWKQQEIGGAEAADDRSARAKRPHFRREGQERHLSVHGWRAVAGRYVRSEAAAEPGARPAVQDEDGADAVQQQRQHVRQPVEVSSSTARAAFRSATCFRTSPSTSMSWRSIRSMTSEFSEHTTANYFLHTGTGVQGRPSMGAWFGYGLGSECRDLPGFVVLNGGLIPPGGLDNFNSGFLPATYQGSIFTADNPPVANIERQEATDRLAAEQAGAAEAARCASGASGWAASMRSNRRSPITSWRIGCRRPCPDLMDIEGRDGGDAAAVRPGCDDRRARRRSAGSACSRGGWSSAACGSSS